MTEINRREFLGGLAAASAFTIVPRRVLGGQGHVAPSDMILLAQVGCGLQSQRQVNCGMVRRPDLQFVAVVDPNRETQDYVDWSQWGNRSTIRKFLEAPEWGANDKGIRGGREVAREIMELYYKKQGRPANGIRAYEDFREMLEKETDIQEDSTISLTVQDNGQGIRSDQPPTNGIGLSGLQERLTIAGGTLNINSRPNNGTILTAELPLPGRQIPGSAS